MVLNATFIFIKYSNYIAAPVLLVEENGLPGENHRPAANH
jgi:hypothetical protein